MKGLKTPLGFHDTCTAAVRNKLFRQQCQVTHLSTGWFLHLLITTTSPAVPCEDPAHWCGGSEWGRRQDHQLLRFLPFPSRSLVRAVHGNFGLVLGNCPGLGERQGVPNSYLLDPVRDFGMLETREQTYAVLSCRHWDCLIPCASQP